MTYITTTFGKVSTDNSSTLALAAAGSYNGVYEQVKEYSSVVVTVIIGAAEQCTLGIDFSIDVSGTNETSKSIAVDGANAQNIYTFSVPTEYFRIRVNADLATAVNGAVQSVYNKTGKKDVPLTVSDSINGGTSVDTTKSVISGEVTATGSFLNANVDLANTVLTTASSLLNTKGVVSGENTAGSAYINVNADVATSEITPTTNLLNVKSLVTGISPGDGVYRTVNVEPIRNVNNSLNVKLTNPVDAFGRVQVSAPFSLFGATQLTTNSPYLWDTDITGTGTSVYNSGYPQSTLNVLASGDKVIRQSHGYAIYQPGKALTVLCTGTLLTSLTTTNVRSRIGYFDDLNDKTVEPVASRTGDGFFFQVVGGATPVVSVVSRSSNNTTVPGTAAQVDDVILQANWNIDKLDGTGPSGVTIDFSKRQIFMLSIEWLGVGNVLIGVFYNYATLWCHEFKFSGGQTGTFPTIAYNCRGSLPIRYEIEATGVPSATGSMVQVCGSVVSEGGFQPFGNIYSIARNSTESVNTLEPVMTMRLNQTATAPIRPRITANVLSASMICSSGGNMIYRIYKYHSVTSFGAGPLSGGGGPVWVNSSGDPGMVNSGLEYDLTANVLDITGVTYPFTLVEQGFFANNADSVTTILKDRLRINSDIAGNSDWIVLAMESIGSAETVSGILTAQIFE